MRRKEKYCICRARFVGGDPKTSSHHWLFEKKRSSWAAPLTGRMSSPTKKRRDTFYRKREKIIILQLLLWAKRVESETRIYCELLIHVWKTVTKKQREKKHALYICIYIYREREFQDKDFKVSWTFTCMASSIVLLTTFLYVFETRYVKSTLVQLNKSVVVHKASLPEHRR